MKSHKHVHWHDTEILAAAGTSPEAVRALLTKHGQQEGNTPTDWAVYQWASRRRIPDKWRARLIYALMVEEKITTARLFRLGSGVRHVNQPHPTPKDTPA